MTGRQAALWTATLIPFSVLPFLVLAHSSYAIGALVLGAGFLVTAIKFAVDRTDANARLLFFGSLIVPAAALGAALHRQGVTWISRRSTRR